MKIALVDPSYYLAGQLIQLRRIGYFPATLPVLAAALPPGHEVSLHYEKCQPAVARARRPRNAVPGPRATTPCRPPGTSRDRSLACAPAGGSREVTVHAPTA